MSLQQLLKIVHWRRRWLGLGAWLHAGRPGCSRRGGLPMVLRKEAERCTRCRRRGWRRSSEALRRRCRRPALCGPLAGILLLVTARHGDPRRRVPPRRRRDPQLRRHFRFGWAGTQDGASQAWNLQLRSPETGTHAYGTYWRGPTLTVRGPTVAIPPHHCSSPRMPAPSLARRRCPSAHHTPACARPLPRTSLFPTRPALVW